MRIIIRVTRGFTIRVTTRFTVRVVYRAFRFRVWGSGSQGTGLMGFRLQWFKAFRLRVEAVAFGI